MSRSVCLPNQPLWYWYRHVNITLNIDILYQIHFTQALLFDQTGKILSLKLINKNSKLLILYSWGVWKTFKVKLRFCNISTQSIQAIVKKYAMFWLTDQGFDSYSINSLKISVLKKIKLNVKNFEKKGLQMRCRFFSPVSIYDICNHLGFWAEKPASFPHWYEFSCRSLQTIDKFKYIDFFFYTGLLHYCETYFNNTRNGKYWLAALWTSFVYFVWFLKF